MGFMAKWGPIRFETVSNAALLFEDFKVSAESETEDKTASQQKYVSRKNGKAAEISMTILLSAAFGIDVKTATSVILNAAQKGETDWLYMGSEKLFPFKLMLTKAETESVEISASGFWTSAKMSVTFKQSTNEALFTSPAAGGSSGGGGNNGGSGGNNNAAPQDTKPFDPNARSEVLSTLSDWANAGINFLQGVIDAAKAKPSDAAPERPNRDREDAKVAEITGISRG